MRLAVSWPVPDLLVLPGVETDVFSSRMTRVYEPTRTSADYLLQELSYLEAAARAEAAGADGFFIHSGGDYGLQLIRETLSIPAFGGLEAAVAASNAVGSRFAIVTVWPAWTNHIYDPLLRRYRCVDRCVSIRNVVTDRQVDRAGGPAGITRALHVHDRDIIGQIAEEMRRAVDDGADSIILGCTCMSGAAELLAERCPVPVIDPLATGLAWAQTTLALGLAPRRQHRHRAQVLARDRLTPLMIAACETVPSSTDECSDTCNVLAAAVADSRS
jgi:Asp/Glu/hydantoin racemase